MAVTTVRKPEQYQNTQQVSQYPQQGYTGLAGVSDNTAAKAGQYQQGYQPSAAVTNAQQQLQAIQSQKPQGYNSKFGPQLDSILDQLQNTKDFKYSFNEDEMFKNYADLYYQQGKQASLDAMGQAVALTGGYGNSYAQNAANQAFQQHLLELYRMGPEFYQMAYQRNRDQLGDKKDLYSMMADADNREYQRHRDEVGDWQGERDYWTGREDTLADRDRANYEADRDYWTGLARVENADYRTEQERQEAIRQYEQDFAEKQRQFNENLAENQRQFDADEAYRRDELGWRMDTDLRDYERGVLESDRNFSENQRQFNENLVENKRQFDADEAYRRDELGWRKDTDERDYDRNVLESDRNFGENQRQFNENMAENQRQFDTDEAYRRDTFEWQKETDQRDFDYQKEIDERNFNYNKELDERNFAEEQRQFDAQMEENKRQFNESLNWDKMTNEQKYAAEYVLDILEKGEMPSEELLKQAGLSSEDAEKLITKLQTGTGTSGKSSGTGKTYYTDMYGNYYEFDKDGNAKMVDKSVVTKNDTVDPSLGNFQYNLGNAVQDAAKTVQEQWDGSTLKQTLDTGANLLKEAGTNLLDAFGLGGLLKKKQ